MRTRKPLAVDSAASKQNTLCVGCVKDEDEDEAERVLVQVRLVI